MMPGTPDERTPIPRCWNCSLNLDEVRLLKIPEAAGLCGVVPGTIRKWMAAGDIEWLRLPSAEALILSDSLPTGGPGLERRPKPVPGPALPLRRCFVCGRPAETDRILLDSRRAAQLCRVKHRTLARWTAEAQTESIETPSGRLYYLDSLFQEPRRHRDLEVRR